MKLPSHPPSVPCALIRAIAACLFTMAVAGVDAEVAAIRGLPFSRVYSLEDIGYIPRGSRLGFDGFGRVTVVHDGVYAVLNDTTWLDMADTDETSRVAMTITAPGRDGRSYYAARASWGMVEVGTDGKCHAIPLTPEHPPAWTQATTFEDVIVTRDGVYFASRSGVAFWDPVTRASQLFELEKVSKVFRVGDRIWVSSFEHPMRYIDAANGVVRDTPVPMLEGSHDNVVERATVLDATRALVSTLDGRLFAFDGANATPWPGQAMAELSGRIAVLQQLADGNIAVAITGKGVFVVAPDGQPLSALTIPQYHRVSDIASHEPGVLWLITEDSIEKVLYGSGLTSFGQRLGLPLEWPLVVNWNGRIFVASAGVLYEAVSPSPGGTARFSRLRVQPPDEAWALAAQGPRMLVGNVSGIYSAEPDGSFVPVAHVKDLSHLVMVNADMCYAIGPSEIGLFEWDGKGWSESTPRIQGLRNASVVHAAGLSAWVEMGGYGVGRVSKKNGELHLMVLPNESWTESTWVNVGLVDNIVVLGASREKRKFFDERSETWCEMPDLEQLLNRPPQWLARVRKDENGTLWATHNEGLVRFTPKDGDFEMDPSSFDLINDRYPVVHILAGNDLWVSASRSLYHVEQTAMSDPPRLSAPVLVSLVDTTRNVELLTARGDAASPMQFPFAQNSLSFRFFSGSYAWRRSPVYEFRLTTGDPWTALDTGSLLRFTGLREGGYELQVRMTDTIGVPGAPTIIPFKILPPWHRTWPAYTLYASLILLTVAGTIRWSGDLARRRNRALEQVVRDRTSQLESTMQKLNEETRITATLAERDRLAGEIHDSVQQGLSGAILQLDTTLKLPSVSGDLRARLNVVRNMVSYARQEVQHAVWDMDSPLLEGNDLGEALRKLTTFVASGPVSPRVVVSGTPIQLPRSTTHHLLRIAQEATTNALRHAAAQEIDIRLVYQPTAVSLTISDDGIGFHAESVLNQAGHFGLRGIRARVRKLSGNLTLASSPGEGTSIHVLVPLTESPIASDAENIRSQQNPNPACR